MDPDTTLEVIRQAARYDARSDVDRLDMYEQLAEAVQALDEWLSKGGFLPTDWAILSAEKAKYVLGSPRV